MDEREGNRSPQTSAAQEPAKRSTGAGACWPHYCLATRSFTTLPQTTRASLSQPTHILSPFLQVQLQTLYRRILEALVVPLAREQLARPIGRLLSHDRLA